MAEAPFRGRRPIFIGDDKIDQPAFDAALAMGGHAFTVGFEIPELSGTFADPGAVRSWLHAFGLREGIQCRASS
jgi:trehalose 6-phosphate phosphatase